jgi:hypothetical protein
MADAAEQLDPTIGPEVLRRRTGLVQAAAIERYLDMRTEDSRKADD